MPRGPLTGLKNWSEHLIELWKLAHWIFVLHSCALSDLVLWKISSQKIFSIKIAFLELFANKNVRKQQTEFGIGLEIWANGHLEGWKLGRWFSVMRTLLIYDLDLWWIKRHKWKTFKVGYLDLQDIGHQWNIIFYEWNDPGKVWKRIRQGLKTSTLKIFLEYYTVVQSIWSHQSQVKSYDVPNKGTDKSAKCWHQ